MQDAQNRLQDRENFKVELNKCSKCLHKNRLVNAKLGQYFCNVCLGLRMDMGTRALDTIAKFTEQEIHTLTEEEIKIYEYRTGGKYMDHFYLSKD